MKKTALAGLPAVFLLLIGAAPAADADDARVGFGVRAGINLAEFRGDDATAFGISPKSRTGLVGGIFVPIHVGGSFFVQPEALYSQKGSRYEAEGEELTLEFDYVELPVLLKVRFGEGAARPSLFAGPSIAFKTRSRFVFEDEEDEAEDVKGTDFGTVFGAAVDIQAGSGAIVLDARYTLGLTGISEGDSEEDVKNSAWSFSIGYAF